MIGERGAGDEFLEDEVLLLPDDLAWKLGGVGAPSCRLAKGRPPAPPPPLPPPPPPPLLLSSLYSTMSTSLEKVTCRREGRPRPLLWRGIWLRWRASLAGGAGAWGAWTTAGTTGTGATLTKGRAKRGDEGAEKDVLRRGGALVIWFGERSELRRSASAAPLCSAGGAESSGASGAKGALGAAGAGEAGGHEALRLAIVLGPPF